MLTASVYQSKTSVIASRPSQKPKKKTHRIIPQRTIHSTHPRPTQRTPLKRRLLTKKRPTPRLRKRPNHHRQKRRRDNDTLGKEEPADFLGRDEQEGELDEPEEEPESELEEPPVTTLQSLGPISLNVFPAAE